MKIVLNSVEDLQELIGVLDAEFLRTWQPGLGAVVVNNMTVTTAGATVAAAVQDNAPAAHAAEAVRGTMTVSAEEARAAGLADEPDPESRPDPADAGLPPTDADGVEHNVAWHSEPAKINADGRWKARRGRDAEAYAKWIAPLQSAGDAEPVATETHALPQDDVQEAGPGVTEPLPASEPETAPTVDYTALIEASQEAAENAPDGTIDLLNAGKEFIKEYGTAKFEALKGAVCPTEDGKGKSIPSMVPAERRLMRACMDNYALYL